MKVDLNAFRKDFEQSMKALETKYGVGVDAGTIRYTDTEFRFKVIAHIGGVKTPSAIPGGVFEGTHVWVKHSKVDPNRTFTVTKVNKVKFQLRDNATGEEVTASKSIVFRLF